MSAILELSDDDDGQEVTSNSVICASSFDAAKGEGARRAKNGKQGRIAISGGANPRMVSNLLGSSASGNIFCSDQSEEKKAGRIVVAITAPPQERVLVMRSVAQG
ncbi:hypothetical protein CVT26_009739 [Gymnopilus dilepis]|uniref:Uncharacterized protein n=1 Tax=Gymnopilus dilepis TaxID=231916 RepID=A0A409YBE8_9AGAR|nr:hypothetical protein CVT26_009739 [Gymnopilus dilepis]